MWTKGIFSAHFRSLRFTKLTASQTNQPRKRLSTIPYRFKPVDVNTTGLTIDTIESGSTVEDYTKACAESRRRQGIDDAFYVCDIGTIIERHNYLLRLIPRAKPYYAVKCNDDNTILSVFSRLGVNFDCASKGEISRILNLGVSPDRIIYANPYKQTSHLAFALKAGVDLVTFDSSDELDKIKRVAPSSRLILRLATRQFSAALPLSTKFGCPTSQCSLLLQKAKAMGLNVIGVAFHVGSECMSLEAFPFNIAASREVMDAGKDLGFNMKILDIGGGLPGKDDVEINSEQLSHGINRALEKHFPEECGVEIISEPGRYYVENSNSLVVNVIGKRVVSSDTSGGISQCEKGDKLMMYYLNDGVYGGFLCHVGLDRKEVQPVPLTESTSGPLYPSIIWGPTCDSTDKITENPVWLPELNTGDWIKFDNMGAYTSVNNSGFNRMPSPDRLFVL